MRLSVLALLALAPAMASATEAEDAARAFMRCSFVMVKLLQAPAPSGQAEQLMVGATVFTTIGAVNATSQEFVLKEAESVATSFAGELRQFGPGVALNPESIAFLIEQESKCRALYRQHQAQYFSR